MTATTAPLLAARGLSKAYPGVVALDDVDFSVASGEVVGLVGKNGAGKSTLIKILAGAVDADAGEISIAGEPAEIGTPHDATKAGLAFVHQEFSLAGNLSVAENVALGAGFPHRGPFVSWRRLRRETRSILERLDTDVRPEANLDSLSPVDQRMVMIAHALAQDARLLVMDEPSASLTEQEVERLHAVIRALAAEGVATIYVSHRLDEILAVTERVVVMRDGQVVDERPTASLARAELIGLITGSQKKLARSRAERDRPPPDPLAETLLDVEQLTSRVVPRAVNFSVRRGEVVGLAGLLGSGRTEIARTIFGAEGRCQGEIRVDGRAVSISSPRQAVEAGIVLLPEDRRREGNVLDFSVRRNLTLGTLDQNRVLGWLPVPSARHEHRGAVEMIEQLGIATAGDRQAVRWLSGGNQQKVMLGRWLPSGAEVLVLDEPTQGIDVEGKEELFEIVDGLAAAGKAVIFISSDFSELVAMCDRVLTVRDGVLAGELRGSEINEAAIVEACYAVDEPPINAVKQ
jgi:ABC-type sugar transport system ATPase subunit